MVFSTVSSSITLLKIIKPYSLQKLVAYSLLRFLRSKDFVYPSSSIGSFLEQRYCCYASITFIMRLYNSLIMGRFISLLLVELNICYLNIQANGGLCVLLMDTNHGWVFQSEALASSMIFCILGLSKSSCMNQRRQLLPSFTKGTSLSTCPPRVVWKQTILSFEHLKIIPLKPSSCILLQSIAMCWILFRLFSYGIRYCAPQLAYTYLPFSKLSRSTALMSSFPSRSSSRNSQSSASSECCWLSFLYSSSSMCRVAPTIFWLCTQIWLSLILGSFLCSLTLASERTCSLTSLMRNLCSISLSRLAEAQIWFISRKVLAKRVATYSMYSGFRSWKPFSKL